MPESYNDSARGVDLGYCRRCGRRMRTDAFRSGASQREYIIGAVCQYCQDRMLRSGCDLDRADSGPVLHGTIVGVVSRGAQPREAALLSFQFDPWTGGFEWGSHHIVHAGDVPEPIDPFVELGAMRTMWSGHSVRVLTLESFADPLLAARISANHVVVALDHSSIVSAVRLCPAPALPVLFDLHAQVPWAAAFGAPLLPLAGFLRAHGLRGATGSADACRASALRQCALIARVLELRATAGPYEGCSALEHFLFEYAEAAGAVDSGTVR